MPYSSAEDRMDIVSIARFVEGFLEGALQKHIEPVDQWITNADPIVSDIDVLMRDLDREKIEWKDVAVHLGSLLVHIPPALQNCKGLPDTMIGTFNSWMKKIKNPLTIIKIIAKAVALYLVRLIEDAFGFVSGFKKGDFWKAGNKLGDIPYVLFDRCG